MTETRLLPAKTQRFIDFLRERLGQADRRRATASGGVPSNYSAEVR